MSKKLKIAELFESEDCELTEKVVDLYLGKQEKHMVKLLNDPYKGRKDWKNRGFFPRHRNIIKMIIDKSGLLFNDKAPELSVYPTKEATDPDESQTAILKMILDKANWIEFFTNFDSLVRLVKTAMVLVQFDDETKELILVPLTQHNSYVHQTNGKMDMLIYRVGESEDDKYEYRVYTKDLIEDYIVDEESGEEFKTNSIPNPFGIIPVAVFHDTNTPMFEFWNVIPTELVQINETYNLHIIDSEFAASWAKNKTLFTNVDFAGGPQSLEVAMLPGDVLPHLQPSNSALLGGPSQVVKFTGENPFIEYRGADVDLQPIDDMVNKWVADYAADWSVNVKGNGGGAADSGFKLIVEEMPNLELRKKRARMFEAGFARLFQTIKKVVNIYVPGTFTEDSILFTKFPAPSLPVDKKMEEEVWGRRISEGRASRVDYFVEMYGMTKDEAQAKIEEIDAVAKPIAGPRTVAVTKTVGQ